MPRRARRCSTFSRPLPPDTAVGVKGVAVSIAARDGERYVAHVLPLTAGKRRRAGTMYAAVAALFIRKAALDLPSPFEMIAGQFRLTPAELRVLFAVIEVGGAPEVAEVLGVTQARPAARSISSNSLPGSPIH